MHCIAKMLHIILNLVKQNSNVIISVLRWLLCDFYKSLIVKNELERLMVKLPVKRLKGIYSHSVKRACWNIHMRDNGLFGSHSHMFKKSCWFHFV